MEVSIIQHDNIIKHHMLVFKKHIVDFMALILIFFTPILPAVYSIIFLGGADFLTGILAAKKRGEEITSNKMFRSIIKVLLYNLLLITSFIVQEHLMTYIPWVKLATSAIATIEIKSLYENASTILGIDLWKYVKNIMDKNKPEIDNRNG
jgi:uncharacterized membrane protein HdeD (DUF308 family)